MLLRLYGLAAMLLIASGAGALAVTDEIQVYTGDIEPPGVLGLTWHNNYTPSGIKTPDFPGALIDNHAYSSVLEWAYGVTPWFEAGLYLPLYADTASQGWTYNGFKLRALFVQPDNADKDFYYGVNFEFSWNEKQWDIQVNTGEIRPIIGWRFGRQALELHHQSHPGQLLSRGFRGWNSCPRRGWTIRSTTPGPWRRRNMTISAICSASCPATSNCTSSGRWPTIPAIPFRWRPASASA